MLTLHELQKQFVENLKNLDEKSLTFIRTHKILSSKQHFVIYQNSIRGIHQKALQEIYPVCNKLVGDDFFIAMINEYIMQTDFIFSDLEEYGSTLPEFISEFTPAKALPYLSDVAQLEWAWHRVFHAEENKTLDLNKLSACYAAHGESILFLLQPESHLLSSNFPIHRIWEMNQNGFTGDTNLILTQNESYFFLIWRKQLSMRIDVLSQAEWQILSWMQQSLPLGNIAEQIENNFPDISLSDLLIHFIQQGWISDFAL
jgi:hypothetical protein